MRRTLLWFLGAVLFIGCSDDEQPTEPGSSGGVSGGKATGGSGATGGVSGAGRSATGGSSRGGGAGTISTGGAAAGSTSATGGAANGGTLAASGGTFEVGGGAPVSGGVIGAGGVAGSSVTLAGSAGEGVAGSGTSGGANGAFGGLAGMGGVAGASLNGGAAGATQLANGGMAASAGVAGSAGSGGMVGPWVKRPGCGAVRESVVGWWSFEDTLGNRNDLGRPLTPISGAGAAAYVDGIASGRALDLASGAPVEATDSAFNVTVALTLSAFVKASAPNGRIIDRITAGGTDGFLLDVHNGHLRLIIGSRFVESTATYATLPAYSHVAGVFTGGSDPELVLYLDGVRVGQATIATGDIPTNALPLRIGIDQDGNNRFSGQIDEPMVIARALGDLEVQSLGAQLAGGQCPSPSVVSPANGLLLEHDDTGTVQSGALEHLRGNIRRAGDLRVLHQDSLYNCDWNAMTVSTVSSCQVWAPFALREATAGDYFEPSLPLEWRLFKFNTTGLVDQIGTSIEAYGQTLHQQSHARMSWFGRDWRVKRYAVDASGTGVSGGLPNLAQELRNGAGLGVFVWGYSLPHLTSVVRRADDHFAGLDPWHISTDAGSMPGESVFQGNSYHYAVWFDTLGFSYASRWNFGSNGSISDSSGTDATDYFTEPGWVEVLAHDANGLVTGGSKQALVDAIQQGAALRVESPEGFEDCGRVQVSGDTICYSHDTYVPVDLSDIHVGFDGTHSRRLRSYTTNGQVRAQNWADHTANLVSENDTTGALRWFVQSAGWGRILQTNASGEVVAGNIGDLVSAIQGGAEVTVARLGETRERVRCDSLRVDSNSTRAACLSLLQFPGRTGGTPVPGYYEARVYNTSGYVATTRVAFGSTSNESEDASIQPLLWFVRRE